MLNKPLQQGPMFSVYQIYLKGNFWHLGYLKCFLWLCCMEQGSHIHKHTQGQIQKWFELIKAGLGSKIGLDKGPGYSVKMNI